MHFSKLTLTFAPCSVASFSPEKYCRPNDFDFTSEHLCTGRPSFWLSQYIIQQNATQSQHFFLPLSSHHLVWRFPSQFTECLQNWGLSNEGLATLDLLLSALYMAQCLIMLCTLLNNPVAQVWQRSYRVLWLGTGREQRCAALFFQWWGGGNLLAQEAEWGGFFFFLLLLF